MKNLLATKPMLMAVLFAGLFGCSRDASTLKYKQGDIVYLKPDSCKAVIVKINKTVLDEEYHVRTGEIITWYSSNEGDVFEEQIYGK